jgi:Ca2+-transporting ATPase
MAALRVAVLCNNAEVAGDDGEANGDPMEVALLEGGAMAGLQRGALLNEQPEEREESFDPDTKMMATFHRRDDGCLIAIKGAPEAVIEVATRVRRGEAIENLDEEGRRTWRERNESLAADGLRVLALAEKTVDDSSAEPYEEVTLIGLAGLYDPPRESVAEAIRACREAGIRVVMVTGDQAATALNVGREVGIIDDGEDAEAVDGGELSDASPQRLRSINVFSRVSPEQKLTLAAALQDAGEIVAMTGDGVNDAPALKKADIGIAMGQRGTDVARDAGDIVLKDDAFETIVMAVRQGRSIFANIRRFVVFLLSGNLGQVLAISLAALLGAPLPLLPLQILYLNMLLDVFPALALGMGEDETSVMEQPPRDPDEAILTRDHWLAITAFGLVIAGSVLAAFAISLLVLDMEVAAAVTVSFLTYAFARLWHLFNMRSPDSGLFRNNVVTNPYVWTAIVLCVGLIVAALYFAPLAALLQLSAPGVERSPLSGSAAGTRGDASRRRRFLTLAYGAKDAMNSARRPRQIDRGRARKGRGDSAEGKVRTAGRNDGKNDGQSAASGGRLGPITSIFRLPRTSCRGGNWCQNSV